MCDRHDYEKEDDAMKKYIVMLFVVLMLAGCSSNLKELNAGDFPIYGSQGIYDEYVMNVQSNTEGPAETYDELMSDEEENAKIDSLYRIKINQIIENSEAQKLGGWSRGFGDNNCTFYKGTIEYDYFNDKEMNDEIVFRMPGTLQMQRSGSPPYAPGDIIAVVTQKKEDGSDITRLFKSYAFIYDMVDVSGTEHACIRGQRVLEIDGLLANKLSAESIERVTTTTVNPVVYYGAVDISEIADILLEKWK